MSALAKRSTVYFDPAIHNILKVKSLETSRSISELIHEAILHELAEDADDPYPSGCKKLTNQKNTEFVSEITECYTISKMISLWFS